MCLKGCVDEVKEGMEVLKTCFCLYCYCKDGDEVVLESSMVLEF